MKKIIVLGATGNTGAYLIDYLFENIALKLYRYNLNHEKRKDIF